MPMSGMTKLPSGAQLVMNLGPGPVPLYRKKDDGSLEGCTSIEPGGWVSWSDTGTEFWVDAGGEAFVRTIPGGISVSGVNQM